MVLGERSASPYGRIPKMTPATEPRAVLAQPASVLVVCTGNICRSPAAQALLARSIGADSTVQVRSAGTRAVVGSGVSPAMAALLDAMSVPTVEHHARQLTRAMVRDSTLIVGMTLAHRAEIVGLHPSAVRRTFTLRELARLAHSVWLDAGTTGTMAERLTQFIGLAGAARRPPERPSDDEIADPYGGKSTDYTRALGEIEQAVHTLSAALYGAPSRRQRAIGVLVPGTRRAHS